jgi:EmrB/QacA subfamily drug resistance transporter
MAPLDQTLTGTVRPDQSTCLALVGLSLSMLMPSLDTSIANVGLPTLAEAFDAPFQSVQWVVLAYLLTITALIVSAGRLGDMLGRRRLLLAGVGLFTAASAACGFAPTLEVLIAARAAQGLGAALMTALTMALVGETVPKARIGAAMGLLGTMSAVGTSLGPSLGGLLIDGVGWRSIFLINLPLGLLNLYLAWRTLPADRPRSNRSAFDGVGTAMLALTLGAYALAMTSGRGTFGAHNLALLGVALVAGMGFLFVQAHGPSPLIQLSMFRDRTLSTGLSTSALVATVMMTTLVVGPFYLSRALGLEPARVGLMMSAGPRMAALAGVPAGRVVDRFGGRRTALAGLVGMVAGLLALTVAPGRFGVPGYVGAVVVVTACYALFQAANNTTVMADVPAERRGVVSGMLTLSRNLGLVTGASAMGALFAFAASTTNVTAASPDAVAAGMRTTFLVAAGLVVTAAAVAVAASARRRPS